MHIPSRQFLVTAAVVGALALTSGCGGNKEHKESAAGSDSVAVSDASTDAPGADGSASPSASASASASASPSASADPSASASAKNGKRSGGASGGADGATKSGSGAGSGSGSAAGSGSGSGAGSTDAAASAPDFPVPVTVGNATQLITVKANGSYATVTAWSKGPSGWKAQFSTASARVGSNGVTNGSTRRQGTYTTPTGTYTLTEGFGVQAGGTAMPYKVVGSDDWWVEDPESKYYNSMHSASGGDFPLTESGDRGSEHLVNYPTQYAKALVINFNRWPATPGRGAGIFLHVNGNGATAGCVSVPRATMDRIMGWVTPGHHPRIAIG
ncbi:L,D-transpeptidase family protein [Streptomyces sp. NPDC051322]|uniref:L,D-transpeptidase family protein n=1 Tax=Streptomyces sp. NPDC051322 TaxID=3154645 RepID=UPI00345063F0